MSTFLANEICCRVSDKDDNYLLLQKYRPLQ